MDETRLTLGLVDTVISADKLTQSTRAAVEVFIAAGTPASTMRSYRSALAYWAAWLQVRYDRSLADGGLPPEIAAQFIVDHLERPYEKDNLHQLLPPHLDAALVLAGVKGKRGPLAYTTVCHRLAVITKWHDLKGWDSPCAHPSVKTLLRAARNSQARQGVTVRKKNALLLEPMEALIATCTDGVRGIRDRALLLLAWSGGGRSGSEVTSLRIEDLRQVDADTWLFALGTVTTEDSAVAPKKPLVGPAAWALSDWLAVAPASSGPLFRRLYRGGAVSTDALSSEQVASIVKHRAALAGLEGDWAAHSLRSGFVMEAGRQGVPLDEVMAMTEYRCVMSVMGYLRAGSLLNSRAANLMESGTAKNTAPASRGSGEGSDQ
ncbi:site-specific integrase [Pseudomonas hunanensis]|uniref:site-specific integrase n=1 Tax=Pseudomonas hunanensis TaxID=1247546 RepID=UPI003D026D81